MDTNQKKTPIVSKKKQLSLKTKQKNRMPSASEEIATSDEDDLLNSPKRCTSSTPKSNTQHQSHSTRGSFDLTNAINQFEQRKTTFAVGGLIKESKLAGTSQHGAAANSKKQTTNKNMAGAPSTSTALCNTGANKKDTISAATASTITSELLQSTVTQTKKQNIATSGAVTDSELRQLVTGASQASTPNAKSDAHSAATGVDDVQRRKKHRGGKRYQQQKLNRSLSAQTQIDSSIVPNNSNQTQSHRSNTKLPRVKPTGAQNRMASIKRQRSEGSTPPDVARQHKMRKGNTQASTSTQRPQTMAEVVQDAHLMLAVVDMPVSGIIVPFTKDNYNKIYETITAFVVSEIKKSNAVPTFDDNTYVRGVMRVRCSTPASKTWLKAAIPYIPSMWPNMSLQVFDWDKMPAPRKLLGLFPNCKMDCDTVCTVLQEMNRNISVNRWTVLSHKQSHIGTHVAFAVSEDQYQIVMGLGLKLYFGAARATFKDLSEKVSTNAAQTEQFEHGESDEPSNVMEVSEPSEDELTIIETIKNTSIESDTSVKSNDAHVVHSATLSETNDKQKQSVHPPPPDAIVQNEQNVDAHSIGATVEIAANTSCNAQQINASAPTTTSNP